MPVAIDFVQHLRYTCLSWLLISYWFVLSLCNLDGHSQMGCMPTLYAQDFNCVVIVTFLKKNPHTVQLTVDVGDEGCFLVVAGLSVSAVNRVWKRTHGPWCSQKWQRANMHWVLPTLTNSMTSQIGSTNFTSKSKQETIIIYTLSRLN